MFSDYQVNQWLSDYNRSWISLHFNDPQLSSSDAYEVYGGNYERQLGTFNIRSARTSWLSTPLTWSGLPATDIIYIGGWDESAGGNLLWSCPAPKDVNGYTVTLLAGSSYTLASASIAISIV